MGRRYPVLANLGWLPAGNRGSGQAGLEGSVLNGRKRESRKGEGKNRHRFQHRAAAGTAAKRRTQIRPRRVSFVLVVITGYGSRTLLIVTHTQAAVGAGPGGQHQQVNAHQQTNQ
ncbi:hypothetical protein DUE52_02970 [Larkinella punicea]|uniref:Uncharacterized protein n=1 Tax=Larkinella punicea TaxID=2315727 RepID=A0A368JU96_9BACT|nr:hypothetical protein DUE52_02970 [Larkinella punicea]